MGVSLHGISKQTYIDEVSYVPALLSYIDQYISFSMHQSIDATAYELAESISNSKDTLVEDFLQEYSLSTTEGIALICLAECLLRIPDNVTANQLLNDKLLDKDWKKHIVHSKSMLVKASAIGLTVTAKMLGVFNVESTLASLLKKYGRPIILQAVKKAINILSDKFILGADLSQALKRGKGLLEEGYNLSFDILGESARTKAQADYYYTQYLNALDEIAKLNTLGQSIYQNVNLSVKLSALHPKVLLRKHNVLKTELLPRLLELVAKCKALNVSISFDAEESFRQEVYLLILEELMQSANFQGVGFVVQAYSKRTFAIIDWIAEIAKKTDNKILIRLVKGAYWDSEIKYAQENGLTDYPVFTKKLHTDISYLACAIKLFEYGPNLLYPQFATHNAQTAAAIMRIATHQDFEFQRLQGMGNALHKELLKLGYKSRIYAPVGKYEDLLAYLMRRLLENSANTSFVHLIQNKEMFAHAVTNPVTLCSNQEIEREIMPPGNIYENRENSIGMELGNTANLQSLSYGLKEYRGKYYNAASLIQGEQINSASTKEITAPFCNMIIGAIAIADEEVASSAIKSAEKGCISWAKRSQEDRSNALLKFADLLYENRYEIYHLLQVEAGKTIDDAINELREAMDFARYYANQALKLAEPVLLESYTGESNQLTLHPKGIFACISPWNFPLAIFCGQILAALSVGNSVIAKASENTSIIAWYVVKLMIEAGIDKMAINLLLISGRDFSDYIISNPKICGCCFTGSNNVAISINRALARRDGAIGTIIAETGGQNAMIIDSSALLEQSADAIITSAFGSAGQRCSALRVLYIQSEIFEPLIELIKGEADELLIGPVTDLNVDIGAVINNKAKKDLLEHVDAIQQNGGKVLYKHPVDEATEFAFIAPRIIQINSINDLKEEQFGPILHVIKFDAGDLQNVIDEINSTGFGLTFGIHTRIEKRAKDVARQIKAGNIYVNRSIIGAHVGTHPFGGEGLSGTGFKAGGPHYLLKFVTERVETINTSAIGGNIKLLA